MRNTTSTDETFGVCDVSRFPPAQPMRVATMMTTPPIVGVPRLVW